MRRKKALVNGEIYHVFNKSIAGFRIFNREEDYQRFKRMLVYYRSSKVDIPFSHFLNSEGVRINGINVSLNHLNDACSSLVQIIAYCIMPTHIHLILKQLLGNGITRFMSKVLNSYSKYFNEKVGRNGPLWEGPFKNVLVSSDEQLLHLTRYVHLNPVTAAIVDDPSEWAASSFSEYLCETSDNHLSDQLRVSGFSDILKIQAEEYRQFVMDGIDYQRQRALIKALLFE